MSQELPPSPAKTYSSKKRAELEKEKGKGKRKANSDDDTRDSVDQPAVKETPQKEEGGYGTELDRESPVKALGSPDLAPEGDDLLNVRHFPPRNLAPLTSL